MVYIFLNFYLSDLLLLDEPAAGLNPSETAGLMENIRNIKNNLNKSIFLIEHDMKLVMGISDRIVVFDYGQNRLWSIASIIFSSTVNCLKSLIF